MADNMTQHGENLPNAQSEALPQKKSKERGAVLMLVLIVLTALSILSVEFSRYAFLDYALSSSTRSILQSKLLTESAEQYATIILTKQYVEETFQRRSPYDFEESPLLWEEFSAEFSASEFEGEIADENSLFPLNRIVRFYSTDRGLQEESQKIFLRLIIYLLKQHGYSANDQELESLGEGFLKSIFQWTGLEELDEESKEWYLDQDVPRLPPKRIFQNPQELWLLRWPDLSEEWQERLLLGRGAIPGLLDLVTTWSMGPMNMNTLQPFIVAALNPDPDSALAFTEDILEERADKVTRETTRWYNEIFEQYGLALPIGLVDNKSRVYRLLVDIGSGARKTQLLSIGMATDIKVIWSYRLIQ